MAIVRSLDKRVESKHGALFRAYNPGGARCRMRGCFTARGMGRRAGASCDDSVASPPGEPPPRSGRLGVDALAVQQVAQFARGEHLADDVAAADELALDIELRDGRPLAEVLDALTQGRIGQHIDAL